MEMFGLFNLLLKPPDRSSRPETEGRDWPRQGHMERSPSVNQTIVVGMKPTTPGMLTTRPVGIPGKKLLLCLYTLKDEVCSWHTVKGTRDWNLLKS